jgi:hypothetical protein
MGRGSHSGDDRGGECPRPGRRLGDVVCSAEAPSLGVRRIGSRSAPAARSRALGAREAAAVRRRRDEDPGAALAPRHSVSNGAREQAARAGWVPRGQRCRRRRVRQDDGARAVGRTGCATVRVDLARRSRQRPSRPAQACRNRARPDRAARHARDRRAQVDSASPLAARAPTADCGVVVAAASARTRLRRYARAAVARVD